MKTISTAAIKKAFDDQRGHRGFMPDFRRYHTSDTISVSDAARLFAVKRVAEYVLSVKYPAGKDYLHMQTSCFIAAGIADEFVDEIRKIWTPDFMKWLAALDFRRVRCSHPSRTRAGARGVPGVFKKDKL